ncbi:MAG: hypothetical protein WA510_05275 [Acidobacteriaceae bacterium]
MSQYLPQLFAAADIEQGDREEYDGIHDHQEVLHDSSGIPGH